ncbi:hypothetical protein HWQ67_17945 [Candidatus Magnetobacterium casensis]|uniref:Glycosyltransferase n=2 Tax=Candidatus Magnetobacterium casense TaxID=1455061 RepID=A0ABS6S4T6_9BACT|nr:hypothetical protein [Candidatus Magnetobacterium casensis]
MPEYIEVCLRSIDKLCRIAGIGFRLVTPEDLSDYVPTGYLEERYRSLKDVGQRVDCIRAALLARHGGWWWDADTVCVHPSFLKLGIPPHEYLSQLCNGATAVYTVWDREPRRVLNGYVYVDKSPLATTWLAKVNAKLQEPEEPVWCDLGEKILTPLFSAQEQARQVDRRMFLPIDIDSNVKRFFEPGNPQDLVTEQTICFGLNHSWFWYHRRRDMQLPRERWASSLLLIHQLLHLADVSWGWGGL